MAKLEHENRAKLLNCRILQDLPSEKLDRLAVAVVNRVVPPQGMVFREGEQADSFYIVASGKVKIFVNHESGTERELAVLGPGESFGEIALLTGEARTASVAAVDETHLMIIPKEDFERLLDECPDLSRKFMKDVRKWLLKDQEIIEEESDQAIRASRLHWYDFLLVIGVSILLAVSFNQSNPNGIPLIPSVADADSIPVIDAADAMKIYQQGNALVIDAMPSNFYQKGHIKGAVNMPMALFDIVYLMNFSDENKDREILVYGNSISRPYDLEIASKLRLLGYTEVKVVGGGFQAWEKAGYPVERGAAK
ncbi:MAG: cyclic nucleotide-binding domain-containing protein [Syntrophobacteraceae bacterium]